MLIMAIIMVLLWGWLDDYFGLDYGADADADADAAY